MKKMRHQLFAHGLGALALFLAAPVLAAGLGDHDGAVADATTALEARIAAGDLEYRDPATREIVIATAERVADLRRDLAPLFQRPTAPAVERRPNGTVRVDAEGVVGHVHLMRVDLDGGRTTACVETLDGAVAFFLGVHSPKDRSVGSAARPVAVD